MGFDLYACDREREGEMDPASYHRLNVSEMRFLRALMLEVAILDETAQRPAEMDLTPGACFADRVAWESDARHESAGVRHDRERGSADERSNRDRSRSVTGPTSTGRGPFVRSARTIPGRSRSRNSARTTHGSWSRRRLL